MSRTGRQDWPGQPVVHHNPGCKVGATVKLPAAPGHRWGVVLAGGDGVRLQSLTRLICGDSRPKQFCAVIGSTTLLGQTLARIEPVIAQDQTLVSLTAHHEPWYSGEAMRASQRIVQSANKGTAPPIVHSLLSINGQDANAVVAILPSDHHFADDSLFQASMESAFRGAEEHPEAVILLGARPTYPEVEYGWIELAPNADPGQQEICRVKAFWEKPSLDLAQYLLTRGALWNTFVMVGSVQAFLQLINAALPELTRILGTAPLWQGRETFIDDATYRRTPSVNFSHSVLSENSRELLVLSLADASWSDLGDPARVVSTARRYGWQPAWLPSWKPPRHADSGSYTSAAAVASP